MDNVQVSFGSPELWQKVYSEFKEQLDAIKALEPLLRDMLSAGERKPGTKAQRIIHLFAWTTARTLNDLIVLVGNGCGLGAVTLSRGMFEYAVMAEYLRHNPREASDYVAFLTVLQKRRYDKLQVDSPANAARIKPDLVAAMRSRYRHAAARLTDSKGKIRRQWHRKSLRQMAEEIGRGEQYATPYSIAASIHHGSPEGVAAHFHVRGDEITFGEPSLNLLDTALISGHLYSLQAFESLNNAMHLGFKKRLSDSVADFMRVWKRS